jgi:hypothetical protein
MARTAIRLYRATQSGEYAHMPEIEGKRSGELSKMRYWGLSVEESGRREDGGRSGWWCLTPDGRAFVEGKHRVQRYAWIYNGRLVKREGEMISITDCLGEKFNYAELMSR